MSSEFVEWLIAIANRVTWEENAQNEGADYFDVNDYCGGNFDDAYLGGTDDGKILLARQVLDDMNINWKED